MLKKQETFVIVILVLKKMVIATQAWHAVMWQKVRKNCLSKDGPDNWLAGRTIITSKTPFTNDADLRETILKTWNK